MGQDKNSEEQYRTGYGGYGRYTAPQQPGSTNAPGSGQQYGQQGSQQQQGGQQSSYGQQYQQQEYEPGSTSSTSGTYQPPFSATAGMSAQGPTSTGLSARTEAILAYLFWWLGGLVFFVIERKNRFVRFNAAQSIIFFGGVSVLLEALHLISIIPLLGLLLAIPLSFASTIITVVAIITWLFMMFQMYRGRNFRIPIVSEYADKLVDRFTSKKRKATV
ncbi:MAG TPA: hypothetical protein VF026_15160 [Ktedonobacteraceae bacterium]